MDVNGQYDCTEDNLAMAFKTAENPYRTGMFGTQSADFMIVFIVFFDWNFVLTLA